MQTRILDYVVVKIDTNMRSATEGIQKLFYLGSVITYIPYIRVILGLYRQGSQGPQQYRGLLDITVDSLKITDISCKK